MSQAGWPEERVALLRQGFEEKRSITIMAGEFGISRGAVIGKLHRLGLRREKRVPHQKSAQEILAAEERRRIMHNVAQNKRRNAVQGIDVLAEAQSPSEYAPLGIPFADLAPFKTKAPNQCRYMAAEEPGPEFRVCGHETSPGKSWCAHCTPIVRDYRRPSDAEQARLRNFSRMMKAKHAMRSGV